MTQYSIRDFSWPFEYPRVAALAWMLLLVGWLLLVHRTASHFGLLPPIGEKEVSLFFALKLACLFGLSWGMISFSAYRGVSIDMAGAPRIYYWGILLSGVGTVLMLARFAIGLVF